MKCLITKASQYFLNMGDTFAYHYVKIFLLIFRSSHASGAFSEKNWHVICKDMSAKLVISVLRTLNQNWYYHLLPYSSIWFFTLMYWTKLCPALWGILTEAPVFKEHIRDPISSYNTLHWVALTVGTLGYGIDQDLGIAFSYVLRHSNHTSEFRRQVCLCIQHTAGGEACCWSMLLIIHTASSFFANPFVLI